MTNQFSIIQFKKEHVNLKFTAFQNLLQKPKHFNLPVFEESGMFFKTYNYDIFFQSHILKGNDTKWMSSVKQKHYSISCLEGTSFKLSYQVN